MIDQDPPHRIYADFNAGAPLRPAVRDAVLAQMSRPGNASSVHAEGRAARTALDDARSAVGVLVGVPAERVTFTSGATEAASLALAPDLDARRDSPAAARLLMGATEHPAVLNGHRFPAGAVGTVPVDRNGVLDCDALAARLAEPGRAIVAVQAANGETGVVQPLARIAALVHAAGGLLVCDAAQGLGRIDCRAAVLGADVLLLSSHKLGGPQGVGALVLARPDLAIGAPLQRGGGQERGVRGGTENVPGIAGFGVAARLVRDGTESVMQLALRERFETGLRALAPDVAIFGEGIPRLPNTTAFAVPGLRNDTALIGLDLSGCAVSTGSACSSGKVSRSAVLEAMGVDAHLKDGMIRVSLGWSSTAGDVEALLEAIAALLRRAKSLRAAA